MEKEKKVMASYNDLLSEYKKLAKRADQRLVRLEKYSDQEHYKGVLTYSYARAQRDIKSWSGQDATRFNTTPPKNAQQLQAKIADIKQFLDSPTSTKKGITDIYKARAKTTNKKYGTNFTWQDLANYYESELSTKLDSQYGSKTLIKALGSIKKVGVDPEKVSDVLEHHKKVSDDEVVDEIAKKLLEQGLTAEKLFKK